MNNPNFMYGIASVKGTSNDVNRDTAFAITWLDVPRFSGRSIGLYVVANGLGKEGKKASQLAVGVVSQAIKNYVFEPSDLSIPQIMTSSVQQANQQILTETPDEGSTLTAALLIGNQLHIAHVSESRLYYISGDTITQMTEDHVYIGHPLILDESFSSENYEPRISKILYRALGQSETVNVDFRSEQVAPNSHLLLCTEGLISLDTQVTEAEMLTIIANNIPQSACNQLIELAQKHGSTDDITVIVVNVLQQ